MGSPEGWLEYLQSIDAHSLRRRFDLWATFRKSQKSSPGLSWWTPSRHSARGLFRDIM